MTYFGVPIFVCLAIVGSCETIATDASIRGPGGAMQSAADFLLDAQMQAGQMEVLRRNHLYCFFISLSTYPIVIGTEEGGRPACAAYQRWRIQSPVPLYIGIGCGVLVYSLHCSCNLNAAGRAALIRLISLASEYAKPHFYAHVEIKNEGMCKMYVWNSC